METEETITSSHDDTDSENESLGSGDDSGECKDVDGMDDVSDTAENPLKTEISENIKDNAMDKAINDTDSENESLGSGDDSGECKDVVGMEDVSDTAENSMKMEISENIKDNVNVANEDVDKATNRPHTTMTETSNQEKEQKRRSRKSSVPKRLTNAIARVQAFTEGGNVDNTTATTWEIQEHEAKPEDMYLTDTDIEEYEEYASWKNFEMQERKKERKLKYKYKKYYKPRNHGIDIPHPVVVDSPEGPVTVLLCKLCEKPVKTRASYVAHFKTCQQPKTPIKKVPGEKQECKVCGRLYETRHSLQRHMKFHLGDEALKCQVCGKQFTETKSLRGHLLIHTGEKPFTCSYCGFRFRDRSTWRKHEVRHGTVKPFHCEVCGKDFFLGADLRKHQKIHDKDREYKCNFCEKTYYLVAQLKRHLRTHTGEKPYECQYCGKFYSDQGNLRSHLITHTGIKPFQCDLCGETFVYQCRLDEHMRRHNNERQYQCDICNKSFFTNTNLLTHKKTHSDKTEFRCVKCLQTFDDETTLKEHRKTHKPIRSHVCAFCGNAFVTMFVLKRHSKTCKGKKHIETEQDTNRQESAEFHDERDDKLPGNVDVKEGIETQNCGSQNITAVSSVLSSRKEQFSGGPDKQVEILINDPPDINKTLNNFIGHYAGFANTYPQNPQNTDVYYNQNSFAHF